MKAGVGYCNSKDSRSSGRKVAENAMQHGRIEKPCLIFAFCGGPLDHKDFYEGIRSIVGHEAPIVGGSAAGIITNQHLSYEGYPAGAAILQSELLKHRVASAGDLDKDEKLAGRKLAERLPNDIESKLLLMFYDSVKSSPTDNAPPIMNASPPLINGVERVLDPSIPIVGAGLVNDFAFGPTKQFCGSSVKSQAVVGVLLGGEIRIFYTIMHGCTPKDSIYHTITKIEGPIIYEVDGKPVVKIIDDIYGNQDWHQQNPLKRLTIGVNTGEKFLAYDESAYVNRLISGVLPDGSGIVIFEPDLTKGTEIQFMLRDSNKMIESARKNAHELMNAVAVEKAKPVLGLYIDCAGRAAVLSDTSTEEASEVCRVFNEHDIPLLGFYSGVEIAPLLGRSRGLDWTGVLLILAEEQ